MNKMRLRSLYIFSFVLVVVLSACQSSKLIKPIKEEYIDFDINTAIEMIEKKEKMINDVALKEKVTVMEYEELEKSFNEEFGDLGRDVLSMFFINNMDAEPEADKYVNQNTFYPTVFHQGISITNAVIYKSYHKSEYAFANQTRLSVKEKYTGDDENLKKWTREYIFIPDENGEWKLEGFSGVLNFMGDSYNLNYLDIKQ